MVILPILFSGYYSLLDWNGAGKSTFIGLANYIEMFTNPSTYFVKGIINSAILAGLSIFVQVPLALGLALLISRGVKFESVFRNVYFIPVIISTTVIGQLWMKIYHPNNGMLNILLTNFGLTSLKHSWLADPNISLGAVFFVLIWQYIGYHMLLLYSAIKAIPSTLYEAAEIDGSLYDGSVVSHKELESLQEEHVALKARQAELEEQAIELMELAEPIEAELAQRNAAVDAIAADIAAVQQRIVVAQAEIDASVEQTRAQRAEAASGVPARAAATLSTRRDFTAAGIQPSITAASKSMTAEAETMA